MFLEYYGWVHDVNNQGMELGNEGRRDSTDYQEYYHVLLRTNTFLVALVDSVLELDTEIKKYFTSPHLSFFENWSVAKREHLKFMSLDKTYKGYDRGIYKYDGLIGVIRNKQPLPKELQENKKWLLSVLDEAKKYW